VKNRVRRRCKDALMLPIRIGSAEKLMQSDFAGSDRECDVDFSPYLCRAPALVRSGPRAGVQAILEESKVSERPVATIEHNALAQAHIRFSAIIGVATLLASPHLALAQDTSFGQRLFQDKADCQFCHGIDGDGRGDPRSPGRAANLHETHLNRDQLVEVIACGRPGTEMPHFDKYAYEDSDCYGLKGKNLGNDAARDPHSTSLTKREIEAVVDYILAKFVGK